MTLVRRLVLAALLATACDARTTTQVVVVLHAEPAVRDAAVQLAVIVEGPDGRAVVDRVDPLPGSNVGALARIPIVPNGGDVSRTFRVRATLLDDAGSTVAEVEVDAGYVKDELREVHAWFDDACLGVLDCGEGRTCVRGACVGACHAAGEVGADRTDPECSACERCVDLSCTPIEDGTPCACTATDRCAAGACVTGQPIDGVFAGNVHTCAGVQGGSFFCWGNNRVGQLGHTVGSTTSPVRLEVSGWSAATAASDHTCMFDHGGGRKCWGWNGSANLGLGVAENQRYTEPTEPPAAEPEWAELASGWFHTCALRRGGELACWGNNANAACAVPDEGEPVLAPRDVADRSDWVAVAAGGFHSCGLDRSGRIYCWGLNASGELGVGDNALRDAPTQTGCVDGVCFDDWTAIGAGSFHTCAIRDDGSMWCWGGGLNGQLGVGPLNMDNALEPQRIEVGGWRAVDGGASHTCAIREDRGLYCFGRNEEGQLGLGDVLRRDVPDRVGDATYIRVSAGRQHTCAIREDRTLWCWGRNEAGQLGLGFATPDESPPVTSPRRVCFPPD